jgi:hypothetical protein
VVGNAGRQLLYPGAAQIFAQQDHLQFEIRRNPWRSRIGNPAHPLGKFFPRAGTGSSALQYVPAQVSCDELKLVRGQTHQKASGEGFVRAIGTRNKGGYQTVSHGRSPVGEEPY